VLARTRCRPRRSYRAIPCKLLPRKASIPTSGQGRNVSSYFSDVSANSSEPTANSVPCTPSCHSCLKATEMHCAWNGGTWWRDVVAAATPRFTIGGDMSQSQSLSSSSPVVLPCLILLVLASASCGFFCSRWSPSLTAPRSTRSFSRSAMVSMRFCNH